MKKLTTSGKARGTKRKQPTDKLVAFDFVKTSSKAALAALSLARARFDARETDDLTHTQLSDGRIVIVEHRGPETYLTILSDTGVVILSDSNVEDLARMLFNP